MAKEKNRITKREYETIKNEGYTVIAFRDGFRIMTHGNISLIEAVTHTQQYKTSDIVTIIIHDSHLESRLHDSLCLKRSIDTFQDLFDLGNARLQPRLSE